MLNRVKAIARGSIVEPVPVVVPDRDLIKGVILPDRKMTMEVGFRSENQVPMQLHFYSSEPRIACSSPIHSGETGKLVMDIDTTGLEAGDRLEGAIDIVFRVDTAPVEDHRGGGQDIRRTPHENTESQKQ